jgi:uncharacterized protein YunC (DUF1805 family)
MDATDLTIDGKKAAGFHIDLNGVPLLVARGDLGFVMCGYLNVAAADKFGQAAAVVRGVKTLDELLAKPVAEVSAAAAKLGVAPGMTGREALRKFLK